MKTTITKKLLGLALSAFSITVMAQCPTITNLNVSYGTSGTATITPTINGMISPSQTTYYWQTSPTVTQTVQFHQSVGQFRYPGNGTYSVCLTYIDSLAGCSNSSCTTVTITNMAPVICHADFTSYTDSNCVTHFTNTSTGSSLSYYWNINGANYYSANPSISLANGTYFVGLRTFSNSVFCDSITHQVNVGCASGGTNTACQASFSSFTDSNCVTHFVNTSTGNNLTYNWLIDGLNYSSTNPLVTLANRTYKIQLKTFSSGIPCDSALTYYTINCNNGINNPCPTTMSASILSNLNNGNITVSQIFNTLNDSLPFIYNNYELHSATNSYYAYSNNIGGSYAFTKIPSGSYTLCVTSSVSCNGFLNPSDCIPVSVTNTDTSSICNIMNFSYYTDSTSCLTYFTNTTSCPLVNGGHFYLNGSWFNPTNPQNLANGTYVVSLSGNIVGFGMSASQKTITINCNNTNTLSLVCDSNFSYYTDSTCATYITSAPLPSNRYEIWNIDGTSYYSIQSPINLSNGAHSITRSIYNQNNMFCCSNNRTVSINCNNSISPSNCQSNSQFTVFPDSLNAGNYFAYNLSTGTGALSYLWNFGDGITSTQQYPFHQYAVPGQYVVCLTTTATTGTVTCTDVYCDSSSVRRMASGFLMSQLNVTPKLVTGIKQLENTIGLKAFPNPMYDELTIETTTSNDNKLTYVLVDAIGRSVLTGNLNNPKTIINTSNLEKGFYSLSVANEKGSSLKTIKLVK